VSDVKDLARAALDEHLARWNAADRAGWLALFADDVVFDDPVGVPPKHGLEAAGRQWDASFGEQQRWRLEHELVIVCGDEVAATVRNNGVIDGVSYSFVTIEVWKVNAAGRICAVRAYYEPPDAVDPYFKPPTD
jgi:ketosteroid isomerase-like protein